MSSVHKFRHIFRDLSVRRLWVAWTRSYFIATVVRRCRGERVVRDVLQCVQRAILRPRHTLLLSATAACKSSDDTASPSCAKNITDQEIKELVTELDNIDHLSHLTLYCPKCDQRLVVDRKRSGILYCSCKDNRPANVPHEGWMPYMEADGVVIWRKEYKKGEGAYAYKVYGRYTEVRAEDFAAIQVDGEYRRVWDAAVAALNVVEKDANGVLGQTVLHWEVLWPKLFSNRDYVYIRRHKDFAVKNKPLNHKDRIFSNSPSPDLSVVEKRPKSIYEEGENVHSPSKRKSIELEDSDKRRKIEDGQMKENKVFIILSRSCEHPKVPETKHAIRVTEYWSHMVIRTLDGGDKAGMEYVLTYYDEPSTGTLPVGVTAWATGHAAPAYLDKMRHAASGQYRKWLANKQQVQTEISQDTELPQATTDEEEITDIDDTELTETGNEAVDEEVVKIKHEGTQTEIPTDRLTHKKYIVLIDRVDETSTGNQADTVEQEIRSEDGDSSSSDGSANNRSWWRFFHPLYYFV